MRVQDLLFSVLAGPASIPKKEMVTSFVTILGDDCPSYVMEFIELHKKSGDWPSAQVLQQKLGEDCQVFDLSQTTKADVVHWLEDLHRGSRVSEARQLALHVAKEGDNLSDEELRKHLLQAADRLAPTKKSELITFKTARDRYNYQKTQPAGLITGIAPIDRVIGGIQKGTLMTLAGFVGNFKSTIGIDAFYTNVVECGWNGAFFSLEMPAEILQYYLLARHSAHPKFADIHEPVDKEKMVKTLMTEEQEQFIFDIVEPDLIENEDHGKFEIVDRTHVSEWSERGLRSFIDNLHFDLEFGVVDYVQLFKYLPEAKGKGVEYANEMVGVFKDFAISLNGQPTSWILLAQTNRDGYNRARDNDGAYNLLALAEVNALERDSAYVMFTYADDDLKDSNEVKLNLPKNRFGTSFEDPVTTFIDPRFNIVGEGVEGLGDSADNTDFSSLFDSSDDLFG